MNVAHDFTNPRGRQARDSIVDATDVAWLRVACAATGPPVAEHSESPVPLVDGSAGQAGGEPGLRMIPERPPCIEWTMERGNRGVRPTVDRAGRVGCGALGKRSRYPSGVQRARSGPVPKPEEAVEYIPPIGNFNHGGVV
jgi:hypothetical protein